MEFLGALRLGKVQVTATQVTGGSLQSPMPVNANEYTPRSQKVVSWEHRCEEQVTLPGVVGHRGPRSPKTAKAIATVGCIPDMNGNFPFLRRFYVLAVDLER